MQQGNPVLVKLQLEWSNSDAASRRRTGSRFRVAGISPSNAETKEHAYERMS
jgi:hypothetical protein